MHFRSVGEYSDLFWRMLWGSLFTRHRMMYSWGWFLGNGLLRHADLGQQFAGTWDPGFLDIPARGARAQRRMVKAQTFRACRLQPHLT